MAERLHQVADETQVLQTRLQHEVTAHTAERDRFIDSDLFAYALAFLGTYLLARELGAGWIGGVAAGAAFAYAPWKLTQNGHLHVLSTEASRSRSSSSSAATGAAARQRSSAGGSSLPGR